MKISEWVKNTWDSNSIKIVKFGFKKYVLLVFDDDGASEVTVNQQFLHKN